MFNLKIHMEQLQSVLILAVVFICFLGGYWGLQFTLNLNSFEYRTMDVDTCIVKNYAMLYFNPLYVNSATLEELELLPGVGFKTAQKILELRQSNGFFLLDDELREAMAVIHLPRRYMYMMVGCYLTAESYKTKLEMR